MRTGSCESLASLSAHEGDTNGRADLPSRLWDANTGQCFKTFDNDDSSPVYVFCPLHPQYSTALLITLRSYASITPSSFFLLSSTLSSTLRVYNMYTSKVLKTLTAPGTFISEKHPCPALLFPAPYPTALTTAQPRVNGANGTHMDVDMDMDAAVDGPATAASPAEVRRWPDAWIATGSENGKVVIFDLGTRQVVQILEPSAAADDASSGAAQAGTSAIVALAVSCDGRTVVSGSLEPSKTIHVWHAVDAT